MKYLFDRIILYMFIVYAMYEKLHGVTLIVEIYIMIFVTSILAWFLWDRPSKNNSIIAAVVNIGIMAAALFVPALRYYLPFTAYDCTRSGFKPSYVMIGISAFNLIYEEEYYVLIVLLLAVFLSIFTVRYEELIVDYKRLRDDSEEKREELDAKNVMLIESKDKEIYTATLLERNRIAREIHDNVGHVLSRTILQLGALLTIHKEEPVHGELMEVRKNLDDAMNNIRISVHDLYDESIDLKASLMEATRPLKESDRFELKFYYDATDNVPRDVKYGIIAIVKECVSNIIKHSENNMVDVKFNEHPSMYQLVVYDYGTNKKIKCDDNKEGIGLENIRKRVSGLGGNTIIDTEDGFRVFVTIEKKDGVR